MPTIRPLLLIALLALPAGVVSAQTPSGSEREAVREARRHAREARALAERQVVEAMRHRELAVRARIEAARAMERARPEMERAMAEARRSTGRAWREVDAARLRREVRDATRDALRRQELMERRRVRRGTVDI
jgi:hypothetical protein